MTHRKGFTLIELMVVISIVAVLSSIILASLSSARSGASFAAGEEFAGQTQSALYDARVVYVDFDDAGNTLPTNVQSYGTVSGSFTIPNYTFFSITADTDLHKTGKQLTVVYAEASGGFDLGGSSDTKNQTIINNAISGGNWAMSVWYKPAASLGGTGAPIVGLGSNGNLLFSSIAGNSSGICSISANLSTADGGAAATTPSFRCKSGSWYNIVASVKYPNGTGNSTISLYVNGTFIGSATQTPNYAGVGTFGIGGNWYKTAGAIDDAALYSASLTAMDVYKIYALEAPSHGIVALGTSDK